MSKTSLSTEVSFDHFKWVPLLEVVFVRMSAIVNVTFYSSLFYRYFFQFQCDLFPLQGPRTSFLYS